MVQEQRWQQITELLNDALDLPAEDRSRYLRQVCGDDESLRSRDPDRNRSMTSCPRILRVSV